MNRIPFQDMANAVRALSMDAIHRVGSGHIGLPLGAADVATVLFTRFLKFDPANPAWPDRDRFVLSAGHGSMLLYSLSYLTGYPGMSLDEIKRFRRFPGKTPGHPEYDLAGGIEATTGPLGQGIGMAVGMALSERMLRERFGADLVDHFTYVLAGDGCLMEGMSYEAAAFAGHLNLDRLIVLFDDNRISIDGPVDLATSENQQARFEACGWHWVAANGHDPDSVTAAIGEARQIAKPAIVACRTTIGLGLPGKAGTAEAHGSPPTDQDIAGARDALGWPHPPFEIPELILNTWRDAGMRGHTSYQSWSERLAASEKEVQETFKAWQNGTLVDGWQNKLLEYKKHKVQHPAAEPTRQSSQSVLGVLTENIPNLIGGSADLTPSNLSRPEGLAAISRENFAGRYIHYGVREHAMAAISNGIALHKGFLPYCATFLAFSDYCCPAIRLSALMKQQVIYLLTHDSITMGPDGPTHQSVEQFVALRAMPNLLFFRPADAIEVAECWQLALETDSGPAALVMTREAVPAVRNHHVNENLSARGGYIIAEAHGENEIECKPRVTILATGSEVWVALEARDLIQSRGVATRVVSLPCLELFDRQPDSYRESTIDKGTLVVSLEAGTVIGWDRYVGPDGLILGLNGFGASGLTHEIMTHFGITPRAVTEKIMARLLPENCTKAK